MLHRSIIVSVFILAIGWLLPSCSSSDICLSNQHAVQVKLLSLYSKTDKDTVVEVTAIGLGRTDSVYKKEKLSDLFLPLKFDKDTDTTSFVVKLNTGVDTIYFLHRKQLDFVSGDCGYVFSFEVDSVWFTRNPIDSAVVSYPIVKYGEDATNVKIYIY
jgi:hypothetical protein